MKKEFNRDPFLIGDALEHGEQDNGFDCGICCNNTVAHDVFGDELWIPRLVSQSRVRWFLKLLEYERKPEVNLVSQAK